MKIINDCNHESYRKNRFVPNLFIRYEISILKGYLYSELKIRIRIRIEKCMRFFW